MPKGFTKDMTRLAIIAGKGQLPVEVAAAATADGFDVWILPINGQADADFTPYQTLPIRLGAIGETRAIMAQHKIEKLVMVGKVTWPSMAALRPDFDGVKLLGKMMTKGDDNVLRHVAMYFAEEGIETMAVDAFLPHRKMPSGLVAGRKPDAQAMAAIALGAAILAALGTHDVGQSVIVQNGRVIAIEAAEGSDAMIARAASLLDPAGGIACLVKMRKSTQDTRLDMPVMGCDTILSAVNVGLSLLAIESNSVLLADEIGAIKAVCDTHGVTLIGVDSRITL
ncbi:UDP-2,3-diacylglucosamine diphosphatase LpxI [Alphaproteobacteria bacterium]|nr:UDP-2,3-diacylglucosamine diphosphatase LpxI [Alphaproteobacteria bacterium]